MFSLISMTNTRKKHVIPSVNINSTLVWMDLEMSGLDPKNAVILEIATLITDNSLNIIAEGPNIVIHHQESLLEKMDDWNKKHHRASGLIERIRNSRISLREAENTTLEFLMRNCSKGMCPLCGNSIAQDRRFLFKYMPLVSEWLHYRNIDVSTIKELTARWYPEKFSPPKKRGSHQALNDIKESIDELVYYKNVFFNGEIS